MQGIKHLHNPNRLSYVIKLTTYSRNVQIENDHVAGRKAKCGQGHQLYLLFIPN